ncbi:MAG: hypothetical protein HC826_02535 [Rhodospirillales bacterium]|nr:hypothetical protein [Rhodospirillales bacterium]
MIALHWLLRERVIPFVNARIAETLAIEDWASGRQSAHADCLQHFAGSVAGRASLISEARIVRNALQSFILPILFGLIGTIAFILRKLTEDIRADQVTVTSLVGVCVRVPLGMLAGLAVGWVLGDQSASARRSGRALDVVADCRL